ncbi:uncharacterized protein KD926_002075 [Aspergillus affinis]|uniref:uncharacterized protein n=1 Tax=Aspergillus affinis TaxID=1070780 RepID=UPI0022FF30A1|nr:uncharacterized protein KD926_002075 [Aspergillus affinis]KAI9036312.1 hypothetical protein KD926_002075 [Aspergillus affinis]
MGIMDVLSKSLLPLGVAKSVLCMDESMTGGISIINNLDVDLYVWSVQKNDGPQHILGSHSGRYHELWKPTIDDTGVSLKIATNNDKSNVLQFEYSILHSTLYWDLSCIDLKKDSEIILQGFSAIPNHQDCSPVICTPGDEKCPNVYHEPNDNHAIRGCAASTDIVLEIGQ